MTKAAKVLIIYLLSLLVCSFIFSWLNIRSSYLPMSEFKTVLSPMMAVTVIGGFIALKYTVPAKSFYVFLLIYIFLWIFRFCMFYLANYIGEATVFNRSFRFDLIIPNYYDNVSRIGTPLPFIIFWFINYLFTSHFTISNQKDKTL